MPVEGRPLMVPREDMDTKQRRDKDSPYLKTPRTPTSGTRRNSQNYRTHQPTILLAKDKGRHQTICQKLRHMSTDKGGPTRAIWITTIKRSTCQTMEINHYGLHY